MKAVPKLSNIFSALGKVSGSSKSIVGFSRSILAAGMLLTLLFNDINFVIPASHLQSLNLHSLKFRCNFFLLFNSSHLVVTQMLAIIFMLLIIAGYFMQITALFHFWVAASFFMIRPIVGGGDEINMLLTLLFIPVCLFDKRKNHWHRPVETNNIIQNVFLLIIKLQVAFIYFDSVYDKLHVKEWKEGTAMYYWFTHNFYGLHPAVLNIVEPLLKSRPVLILATCGTLAIEAFLAAALLFPARFRLSLLKLAIIFHFSILLIHGLASFFFAMSAGLFLYLYPSQKTFTPNIFSYEK